MALVLFFSSPFLSSSSFLTQGTQEGGCGEESFPLDLLALSFFLKRLISPDSITPLSFLVLQPLCLRLVDDTSAGYTKVSRLVGRGFCEVSDFVKGL